MNDHTLPAYYSDPDVPEERKLDKEWEVTVGWKPVNRNK